MVSYQVVLTKQAQKDVKRIKQAGYAAKAREILEKLKENPYYEPVHILQGNLSGLFSRRINIQHRIVYEVLKDSKEVKIISMWLHYDNIH